MKRRSSLMICTIVFCVFCSEMMSVNALETTVSVDPPSQEIPQVGETFSISIFITNVTNLFGYDFILWYNTTILDCLVVEWPTSHLLMPIFDPTNVFRVKTIEDNFNETTGAVRVVTTLIGDEPPKNGSGVLVAITFNSTTIDGPSPVRLYWPGFVYPVKLSDPDGNPIPCNATPGEVTVVPEFSAIYMILFLVLMTATITFLKRRQISGKKPARAVLWAFSFSRNRLPQPMLRFQPLQLSRATTAPRKELPLLLGSLV